MQAFTQNSILGHASFAEALEPKEENFFLGEKRKMQTLQLQPFCI